MLRADSLAHQRWRLGAIDTLVETELQVGSTVRGIEGLVENWEPTRATSFAAMVEELAPFAVAPSYDPGVLVPRLYRSRVENLTDPTVTPPWSVGPRAVKRSLLLSHGVELSDQLASAARWAANERDPRVLVDVLSSWYTLKPLAAAGIVSYAARPRRPYDMVHATAILAHCEDPAFRHDFVTAALKAVPELRCSAADLCSIAHDADRFMEWAERSMQLTDLPDYLDDLALVDDAQQFSNASAWFPTRGHLVLLGAFARLGTRVPAGLVDAALEARMIELKIEAIDVDAKAIVDLRQNSDVLRRWQESLSQALEGLDRLPSELGDVGGRAEIQRAMEVCAQRFASDLRREFRSPLLRAGETVGLGILGGISGAAVSGSLLTGALAAAAASGSRAVGGAVLRAPGSSGARRATAAARDHALVLSST